MKKIDTHNEGVYSADVFQVLADYEITRSRRYPCPLALLAIVVKPIASHEAALESAPAIFLSALGHHLRSVDIPSKTGNTFKILLPTTDEKGARAVCERLLSVFKNKFDVPNGSSIAFSLHIGVAAHGGGSTLSSAELFQKTDEALKQSKLKGPNTYVVVV